MKSAIRQRAHLLLYFFAILGAAATVYNVGFTLLSNQATVHAQQDPFLSQRLNRIEQRFTQIESRLNQIEQQTRFPSTSPDLSGTRDIELRLLRSQFETLQLRIAETECGLLRLDQRTLSSTAKTNLRNSNANENDLCRQLPDTPLRLSARP